MSVLTIKRGDRHPITLTIGTDITGADDVRLIVRSRNGGDVIDLDCAVSDPLTGTITHTLDGTLDASHAWDVEVEVTTGPIVRTAPTEQHGRIIVSPDLDGA